MAGGPALRMTYTTASMTGSSGAVVAANQNRESLFIQNIGGADVFVKVDATAVASQGIRLEANGGWHSWSRIEGNLVHAAINGITAGGTSTITIEEGV